MGLPQGIEGMNDSGSEADPVQIKHDVNVQESNFLSFNNLLK